MSHKKAKKKNTAKKQKEKVVYYDDNSTIFDMSGVNASRRRGSAAANETRGNGEQTPKKANTNNAYGNKRRSTAKEKWKTYVSAVKMMFPWMCIALIAIGVLYFVVLFFSKCAA